MAAPPSGTPGNLTPSDPLSSEVTISAGLSEGRLSVQAKSRTVAALDQLAGGVIGIAGAYAERFRLRVERGTAREQAKEDMDEALLSLLPEPNSDGARMALRRVLMAELVAGDNRTAVATEALKLLQAPEVPEHAPMSDEGPAELPADWMTVFVGHAEKAAGVSLREMWGRVLSGEIRRPGTFSLTALRVISELNAETATIFQEVALLRVEPNAIIKPKGMSGAVFDRFSILEDAGLVSGASAFLTLNFTVKEKVQHLFIGSKTIGALLTIPPNIPINIEVLKLTRVGAEIASILPRDELAAARSVIAVAPENIGLSIARFKEGSNSAEIIEEIRATPPT